MGNGIVNSPSLPSGSVPVVSPFKYVIVLGLSIRKNSPYLNKKKYKKIKPNMLSQVVSVFCHWKSTAVSQLPGKLEVAKTP